MNRIHILLLLMLAFVSGSCSRQQTALTAPTSSILPPTSTQMPPTRALLMPTALPSPQPSATQRIPTPTPLVVTRIPPLTETPLAFAMLPFGRLFFTRGAPGADAAFILEQGGESAIAASGAVGTISPAGDALIMFEHRDDRFEYRVVNTVTGATDSLPIDCGYLGCEIMLASHGKLVAVTYRCDLELSAVMIAAQKEISKQLTHAYAKTCPTKQSSERALAWFPDGQAVLVNTEDGLVVHDLHDHERRIGVDGMWVQASIAEDGQTMIAIDQSYLQLWTINVTTGAQAKVTMPGGQTTHAAVLSPDGRYIVFSSDVLPSEKNCLYLFDLQTQAEPVCVVYGDGVLGWVR